MITGVPLYTCQTKPRTVSLPKQGTCFDSAPTQVELRMLGNKSSPRVTIYDPAQPDKPCGIVPVLSMNASCLVVDYRIMLLLEHLTTVSMEGVSEAISVAISPYVELCGESTQPPPLDEETQRILATLPPNWEKTLEAMVILGYKPDEFELDVLTIEIGAGRVTMTPFLEGIGVETPEVRCQRLAERKKLLDALAPHLEAHAKYNASRRTPPSEEDIRQHVKRLGHLALAAYRLGMDELNQQVGYAILADFQATLESFTLSGMEAEASILATSQRIVWESTAEFLATRFGGDPATYDEMLGQLPELTAGELKRRI